MVGEDVWLARLVAGQVLDHLRDDVAGALDAHAVADAQAQPLDLVAVVERDVGDDHAADADRLQPSDGRQLAGAADLDVDRLQRGFGFLGGKFVREAPARRARDEAEPLLPVEPVDLVDDAVDVERQVGAGLLDRAVMGEHLRRRSSQRTSRSLTGMPKPSIRFIASNCVSRQRLAESRPSRARGNAAAAQR